jgi:acyl-homoserine-lactone acylase
MNAFADGLNYYLFKHPEVKPRVIQRFEPWMALSFTEGSIGGDIERESTSNNSRRSTVRFTSNRASLEDRDVPEPSGSNGIAIAPSNTAAHHALLLINPHTSFFFRSELQMVSEEGLNAYGAVTWGQFFIYQGFNDRAGWMHTSSGVDAVDEYLETVEKKGDGFYTSTVTKSVRHGEGNHGALQDRRGHGRKEVHRLPPSTGPSFARRNGKWVSIRLMQEPVKALMQSYTRTKAKTTSRTEDHGTQANSSNNTIFADADGDIAYFHGNFIPGAIPASTGPNRWTAAIRRRSGRDFSLSTKRRTC